MALFEKEHFGKPMSYKLVKTIINNITPIDIAQVSIDTGISQETIKRMLWLTENRTNLTEYSSQAIYALCKIAFKNNMEAVKEKKKEAVILKKLSA